MRKYLILVLIPVLYFFAACKKPAEVPKPVGDTTKTTTNPIILANLALNVNEFAEATGYFVAADEQGHILGEYKYQNGETNVKLTTNQSYVPDRFDLYRIEIPANSSELPYVVGYMGTKIGATYTSDAGVSYNPAPVNITPNFINVQPFDELWVSSDWLAYDSQNTPLSQMTSLSCTPGSKIWVQAKTNGVYKYNLIDLPQGATSVDIPLDALTKTSLQKTISCPGTNLNVSVAARRTATSQETGYMFGGYSSVGNSIVYHYPAEDFGTYSTNILYTVGNLSYNSIVVGNAIADAAPANDATFDADKLGSSMADFKPNHTGSFDYYEANFTTQGMSFVVYSPAVANATTLKFPDLSKFTGKSSDYSGLKLSSFGLYQRDGYNENKLPYGIIDYFTSRKAVEHYYQ